jgi:hypothetical protein
LNLYAFIGNAPVNEYDKLGLRATRCRTDAELRAAAARAGSKCCPTCEDEYAELMQLAQAVRSGLRDLRDPTMTLRRWNARPSGTVYGTTNCRAPGGSPDLRVNVDIRSCIGQCTFEHERVHWNQCIQYAGSSWATSPYAIWLDRSESSRVRFRDGLRALEEPAYVVTARCVSRMLREAVAQAQRHGGDWEVACKCCKAGSSPCETCGGAEE